jgi:hypothetical protein
MRITYVFLLFIFSNVLFADDAETKKVYPSSIQKVLSDKTDTSRWKTDDGLSKLIKLPTGIGNAALNYQKLHKLFQKEKTRGLKIDLKNTEGITTIVSGAKQRICRFVPDVYPPMTDFKPESPDVIVFQAYAEALARKADEYEKNSSFKKADKILKAGIIFGWHLTEDRPNLLTYFLGLSIQEQSCRNYAKYLQRDLQGAKARKLTKYADSLVETMKKVRLKSRRLLSSWIEFSSLAACEKAAFSDKDPVWRQEAILSLGVMQNGFPDITGKFIKNPYQQEIARKMLKKLAETDKVKNIKTLASWCLQNMTEEKIMQIQKNSK